ncbi:MAG: DNA-binding MarR family transcriptional regulator [Granulosicoccus sp.]|jgi:DNA-binding MarR family transcriptional regulator
MPKKKPLQDNTTAFFTFFNEVGIIAQLSRAVLEAHLPDGVSASQFSILNHLIRVSDGRTPLELAKAFQVPKTTMTSTLSGLEQRGLIEMQLNPLDHRSKQVWLTNSGQQFRERAIKLLGHDADRFATKVDVNKIAKLTLLLTQVRTVLDADRD